MIVKIQTLELLLELYPLLSPGSGKSIFFFLKRKTFFKNRTGNEILSLTCLVTKRAPHVLCR